MASFTAVITNIVTTLQNDAALTSFCMEKWGKALTIQREFKRRAELNLENLPIIFITRPSVERVFLMGEARELRHTVRLYCGFHQSDKTMAIDESVEFEERIVEALLLDITRGGNAIDTDPQTSINDEGEYHPIYFMILDLIILCQ